MLLRGVLPGHPALPGVPAQVEAPGLELIEFRRLPPS
jgi:hypothetical protein